MDLVIKIPKSIGKYRLGPAARFRAVLNIVRRRRKIYDHAGIKIDSIVITEEKKGRNGGKPSLIISAISPVSSLPFSPQGVLWPQDLK